MVLVKIEPKGAVRFITLRQSFPHSWDKESNIGGEVGGVRRMTGDGTGGCLTLGLGGEDQMLAHTQIGTQTHTHTHIV